jgi:hypothetical protein
MAVPFVPAVRRAARGAVRAGSAPRAAAMRIRGIAAMIDHGAAYHMDMGWPVGMGMHPQASNLCDQPIPRPQAAAVEPGDCIGQIDRTDPVECRTVARRGAFAPHGGDGLAAHGTGRRGARRTGARGQVHCALVSGYRARTWAVRQACMAMCRGCVCRRAGCIGTTLGRDPAVHHMGGQRRQQGRRPAIGDFAAMPATEEPVTGKPRLA